MLLPGPHLCFGSSLGRWKAGRVETAARDGAPTGLPRESRSSLSSPWKGGVLHVPGGRVVLPWGRGGSAATQDSAAPAQLCQAAATWQLTHGLMSPQGTPFPPRRRRARPRASLRAVDATLRSRGLACPGPPHPPGACSRLRLRWPGRMWVPRPGAAKAPNHTEMGKRPSFSPCYWKRRGWEGESKTLPTHRIPVWPCRGSDVSPAGQMSRPVTLGFPLKPPWGLRCL